MGADDWYGDCTESVLEVGEDIGDGVIVDYFYEEGFGVDAVVEAVEVYEKDRLCLVVF